MLIRGREEKVGRADGIMACHRGPGYAVLHGDRRKLIWWGKLPLVFNDIYFLRFNMHAGCMAGQLLKMAIPCIPASEVHDINCREIST